ncbi:MAG TPA: AMIN domain-containing protein [Terriglobales bacterium]|nr:AMIN domain-containing protein [Terriglobales bacterium]
MPPWAAAQGNTASAPLAQRPAYASVTAMGVAHDENGPAVQIVMTRPIVPDIQQVDRPLRLVIDLPRTRNAVKQKKLPVGKFQIENLRIDQFVNDPPVTRVVVDLNAPVTYSWETVGNRVVVHLKASSPASPSTAQAKPAAQPENSIGFSSAPSAPVTPVIPVATASAIVVGAHANTTSSITAGAETTVLRVARGGEVHVCPGSTVSVTASKNGRNLLLGMNTGALETHYRLGEGAADTILTPDFRLLMPGPGEFDFAVSTDSKGNTCVRGLPGNAAGLIVSELMGDRSYLVNADDEVMFSAGRLQQVSSQIPSNCGCPAPAPAPAVMTASAQSLPTVTQNEVAISPAKTAGPAAGSVTNLPAGADGQGSPLEISVLPQSSVPLPPSNSNDVHVSVEAPLVFRASDAAPPSAPMQDAKLLPARTVVWHYSLPTVVLPPTAPAPRALPPRKTAARPTHRGFFGHIKGFFAALFH